jgi:hypothetical protein
MNVFALDENPHVAAKWHCDKHVPKMVVESAQMLSTAHRVNDGICENRLSVSGKTRVKYWRHSTLDHVLYKAVHVNHPCTVWTRETSGNYDWHFQLFAGLCREFRHRYGKMHATQEQLLDILSQRPRCITIGERTPFPLAMKSEPQCMNEDNRVQSYRDFYQTKQHQFTMKWTGRNQPEWFSFV